MPNPTVRISERAYEALKSLSRSTGSSMQDLLDQAVEELRRRSFLERANESYAALRLDPEAWTSYREELSEWEVTLADGLPSGEEPVRRRRGRAS